MDFLILGPIEVHNETGVLSLGGIKPRAVLAVLLLHANEPVSAERLALALWGEDAPGGAVKTVQVHVSRLRKALGDGDVVRTTQAGYCLRVRRGELDADRFEGLVEDGRRALADGLAENAAAMLREALALWRGPALAELSLEPFAVTEIARLEEQRLAALELRVEADLAAGCHAECVAELRQLVVDNPMRERLACQLMLALYRNGRQTEALETYATTRHMLVEQMGVEPGPHLRELHRAILGQDVGLDVQPGETELPHALDAAIGQPLVGREEELSWLLSRWELARGGTGGVVALTGERGVGKSRLVAELAHAVHRPGVAILHVTGEQPAETIIASLRGVCEATRSTLLVVDAADRADADVHGELARLAPQLAAVPVLVVACAQDARALAAGGDTLHLGALDEDAVRTIATRYAPDKPIAAVPAEWMLEASGGMPRRVHEVASQWARREAARRVTAVAAKAQAGRSNLRTIEDELTGGVAELQAAGERVARAEADEARIVCPYKGLTSFDVADAPYFFGRELLVAELVARVVGASLLGVVGPSGSGKSSVTRAGLLPALAAGVLPGSGGWAQVLIRPGEHPLAELARGLAEIGDRARVVIAVDQFEETFTACEDEQERAAFIAELAAAAADRDGRYLVVIALRADFYGRCADYPDLAGLLAANHVLVGSMQRDELRRAIERPAELVGLRVDPELADALVADVTDEPGGLPLLQTALLELWQRRDGRRLRYGVYEQSGGVRGAVARLAEDAFAQLDEAQQILARGVLMRLASEGEAGVERRRIPLAELETDRDPQLARAVALLTDRRLLTASAGSIELAHEALLREWPRLRDWVQENREALRIHRNLAAAAREWQSLDRDDEALYRGTRLGEALEWRQGEQASPNELEREFLAASEAALTRERVTRRRRLGLVLAALTIGLLAAIGAAVFANGQRAVAESRDLATKSSTLIASDPGLALTIAREALGRSDTEQAQNALRQAALADRTTSVIQAHKGGALTIAVSADAKLVATAGTDDLVRIRRLDSGRLVSTLEGPKGLTVVRLRPDGRRVARTAFDGVIHLSDIDGGRARKLSLPGATKFEFSNDGTMLAVGTFDNAVGIVRLEGDGRFEKLGDHEGVADDAVVVSASFDRDDRRVVTAGYDGFARIWDLDDGSQISLRHGSLPEDASFSPDGRLVATVGDRGYVRIWDARTGRRLRHIAVDDQPLNTVRFSPDSKRIVTTSAAGLVRVSSVAGGPALGELRGHTKSYAAEFLPGGERVVSVGGEGTLRTWDPLATTSLASGADGRMPRAPSFGPTPRIVVSGDVGGDVHVWDPATGSDRRLRGHRAESVAQMSRDGKQIVSAAQDGSVRAWNVADGSSRVLRPPNIADPVSGIAIDPAGERVAIAGYEPSVVVVQKLAGGGRVELKGHPGPVYAVAFSPDGKHVISGSEDQTVRIWRASDGRPVRTIDVHTDAVRAVAYSSDGKRVASAGIDGTVRVEPATGGDRIVLVGHAGPVNSVQFSAAGDRIVTAGADGTVRVWNSAGGEALVALHVHSGAASGAQFGPGGDEVVSAGEDGMFVTPCEVCGSMRDVMRIADARADRALTEQERQVLLGDGD